MNDTFTVPTQEELDEYLRRGHVARSEAIAEMVLWLRMKLSRRPQAPANPPVDATYA
jgi:metal-responsive CopG/Arc/MetJ family transcriptional regulator